MVHALGEIRRVLVPDGLLIDLRPRAGDAPLEVASARETRQAGVEVELREERASDEAADRSMQTADERGWFVKQREGSFLFSYSWDSPGEMREYVEAEWSDYLTVDEGTWRNIGGLWASADADARVRLSLNMLIASWQVLKAG